MRSLDERCEMMLAREIDAWIRGSLAADPPRAKSLVVTIFGDALAPHGDWTWLQSLIDLLRPFSVNDRSVRSSVFRLVKEGWLRSERHGRRSCYGFTSSGRKRFERAHDKIYFPKENGWNSEWTVVFAPTSRITVALREPLRREMQWQGFRSIAPGTFAHPAGDHRALVEILERLRLRPQVVVYSAKEAEIKGVGSLRNLVPKIWDLRPIMRGYVRFIERLLPLMEPALKSTDLTLEQAFVIRTLLIHEFRRIALHDPLLPMELLPSDWPARKAYDLCSSIYRRIYIGSERYLSKIVGPENIGVSDSYFSERFGGLSLRVEQSKLIRMGSQ